MLNPFYKFGKASFFLLVFAFVVGGYFSSPQDECFLNADEEKSSQTAQQPYCVDNSRNPASVISKSDIGELQKASPYPPSILKRNPFFKIKVSVPVVASLEEPEKKKEILISSPEVKKVELFSYRGRGNIKGKAVVFIEDNWTGKVYFVGKGDMVGSYKVLDVSEKEVVLYTEGQEIRLIAKPKPQEDILEKK